MILRLTVESNLGDEGLGVEDAIGDVDDIDGVESLVDDIIEEIEAEDLAGDDLTLEYNDEVGALVASRNDESSGLTFNDSLLTSE